MALYSVIAEGPDFEPHAYDLFVRAPDVETCIRYWREYYTADEDARPGRIDEIPEQGEGAIRWENVPCVYHFEKED